MKRMRLGRSAFSILHSHLEPRTSSLKLQPQPVIRQPNPFRQPGLDRLVIDLVRQMDQPRLARADTLRALYGLVDGEVRRVARRGAKTVEGQDVDVLEEAHGRVGDAVGVGDVGEAADAKSEDRPVAVADRKRNDVDAFVREHAVNLVQVELRFAAADLRVRPDVAEGTAHGLRRRRAGEGMDGLALAEIEGADVIEAHQVIGMRVGEEDEVEARDRIAQQLGAKVGRGVDEEEAAVGFDLHRLPQPLVARIVRGADAAGAAHNRDAGGGACSEEGHNHRYPRTRNVECLMLNFELEAHLTFNIQHSTFNTLRLLNSPQTKTLPTPDQWPSPRRFRTRPGESSLERRAWGERVSRESVRRRRR